MKLKVLDDGIKNTYDLYEVGQEVILFGTKRDLGFEIAEMVSIPKEQSFVDPFRGIKPINYTKGCVVLVSAIVIVGAGLYLLNKKKKKKSL